MNNTLPNNWSNKQTWSIHVAFEPTFRRICEEQKDQFDDVEDVAEAFKSIVITLDNLSGHLLLNRIVGNSLSDVNWLEIAQHYGEEQIIQQLEREKIERATV